MPRWCARRTNAPVGELYPRHLLRRGRAHSGGAHREKHLRYRLCDPRTTPVALTGSQFALGARDHEKKPVKRHSHIGPEVRALIEEAVDTWDAVNGFDLEAKAFKVERDASWADGCDLALTIH